MPYGFNKELGGDSAENVAAIERCVSHLMSQGRSKESAIRICKHARAAKLRKKA